MSPLRRFIAGARCPRCESVDTLALSEQAGQRVCVCVDCGFTDAQDRDAGDASDPRNRGLGRDASGIADGVQAVRLVDPRKG